VRYLIIHQKGRSPDDLVDSLYTALGAHVGAFRVLVGFPASCWTADNRVRVCVELFCNRVARHTSLPPARESAIVVSWLVIVLTAGVGALRDPVTESALPGMCMARKDIERGCKSATQDSISKSKSRVAASVTTGREPD